MRGKSSPDSQHIEVEMIHLKANTVPRMQLADGVNLLPKLSKSDLIKSSRTSIKGKPTQSQRSTNTSSGSVSNNTSQRPGGSPHSTAASAMAPSAEDREIQKFKAIRSPLIHFLAVRPVSMKYLAQTLVCKEEDCKQVLERVGRPYRLDDSKWDLTDKAFRELDVYRFTYPSEDDRKLAIDRAVSSYDRMRLSPNDALWQRLLPVHERGKGKVISKLNLSKATTPRINVQTPKDSTAGGVTPSNDSDARFDRLAPSDAEHSKAKDQAKKTKAANNSQSIPSKGPLIPSKIQKPSEKPSPKLTANVKKAAKKVPPAKVTAKSSEFVGDSDSDEDEEMVNPPTDATTTTSLQTTSTKPLVKNSSKEPNRPVNGVTNDKSKSAKPGSAVELKKSSPSITATVEANVKPKPGGKGDTQPPKKPQKQPAKQSLPPSSSSNSESKHRSSDSSQTSTSNPPTTKQGPSKTKQSAPNQKQDQTRPRTTSSPHKPSPLGSSPPANASALDEQTHSKSRPSTSTSQSSNHTRHTANQSQVGGVQEPAIRKRKRAETATDMSSNTSPHGTVNDPMEAEGAAHIESRAEEKIAKRRKKADTSPAAPMSPPTSVEAGEAVEKVDADVSDSEEMKQAVKAGLRFQDEYAEYEALYREVAKWDPRAAKPHPRYHELLSIHERMEKIKKQCERAAANAASDGTSRD